MSLQTLIDFAGFRLQAMQMLSLDKHVVGSGDACDTLPFADPDACKQLGYVADQLGLAEHNITVEGETVKLHFGADVEAHRGKDGKLYVLDTAYAVLPCLISTLPSGSSTTNVTSCCVCVTTVLMIANAWLPPLTAIYITFRD
jgi:hypothetical protein